MRQAAAGGPVTGVPARQLPLPDLLRELASVHRTRHEAVRHGSDHALGHHNSRMAELEDEYLRRFPEREVDPHRLAEGARERASRQGRPAYARTGAEQPWDPEDLVAAEGRDLTPANIERARRRLAAEGPAAIGKTVP